MEIQKVNFWKCGLFGSVKTGVAYLFTITWILLALLRQSSWVISLRGHLYVQPPVSMTPTQRSSLEEGRKKTHQERCHCQASNRGTEPQARTSSLWQQINRKPALIQRFSHSIASEQEERQKVKFKYLVTFGLWGWSTCHWEEKSYLWHFISQVWSYRTLFPGSKNFPTICLSLWPSFIFSPFMAKAPYHGHTHTHLFLLYYLCL